MIGNRKVLAVIPARGGSKGIPGKNLVQAGGKPLLQWTVDAAKKSALIDRIILSSDDPAIQSAAKSMGCEVPFTRPSALATDEAGSAEVLVHALEQCPGFGVVVLLQPTSPFRIAEDIDAALRLFEKSGAPSVVSITSAAKHPAWMYFRESDGRLEPVWKDKKNAARRQDLPPAFQLNGAVYVVDSARFLADKRFLHPGSLGYEMPPERSLDIDSPSDLRYMKAYIEEQHGKV